jgi:hypothetical protein
VALEGINARLGEQAPVTDQDDPRQAETPPQFPDLAGDGTGVRGVAGVDVQGDGAAVGVGEQPVDDDRQPLLAVPVVAVLGEGTSASLVVAAADVVEDHRPLAEVPPGQLVLDAALAPQQPVHGSVGLLVVGVGDAELVGQGGVVPVARGGELRARGEDPLGDEGQRQGAWSRGRGRQERVEAEFGEGGEDGLDVPVGLGSDDAEGLLRGQQGFAVQGAADQVDDMRGQVGEVAERPVLDLVSVTIRATEKVADVSLALVLAHNLGNVHGRIRVPHPEIIRNGPGTTTGYGKYSWLQIEKQKHLNP